MNKKCALRVLTTQVMGLLAWLLAALLIPASAYAARGCLDGEAYPSAPVGSSESVVFNAVPTPGALTRLELWREHCDPAPSRIFLRVTPVSGMQFFCESQFEFFVDGKAWQPEIVYFVGSYQLYLCEVSPERTYRIVRYPFWDTWSPYFDPDRPITLRYSGIGNVPGTRGPWTEGSLPAKSASAPPPTAAPSTVIEYYNASLDHYFITWVAAEIANLDSGKTVGWARTGQSFNVYAAGASPVCRFYIPPGLGDSHFFGRGTAECNSTGQKNPSFVLESSDFMQMVLPTGGVCPSGTRQVYRVFSNRPDANHRYMIDRAIRDQMVARGWIAEGDGPDMVVMCGRP